MRLVFKRTTRTTNPTPSDHLLPNHLRPIPKNRQLNLFDDSSASATRPETGQIWAFCANIDQLALQYTREDSVLGLFSIIQDSFRSLPNAEEKVTCPLNNLTDLSLAPLQGAGQYRKGKK